MVVFFFLVTSLSTSMANFHYQTPTESQTQQTSTFTMSTSTKSAMVQFGNNNPALGTFLLISLAFVALAMFSAIIYIRWTRNKRRKKDEFFWVYQKIPMSKLSQALALAFVILLLGGLIEAIRILGPTFQSGYGGGASDLGQLGAVTQYAEIATIIAGSGVGIFILLRRSDTLQMRKPNRAIRAESLPIEERAKELKGILDEAISSLDLGRDYRSTIINCYKGVVSLLERSGMPQQTSLTPREFEEEIASRIGLSRSKYLHEITKLFERARYSNEELSSKEAASAQFYFTKMSSELSPTEQRQLTTLLDQ
jgi:hypothetical protein